MVQLSGVGSEAACKRYFTTIHSRPVAGSVAHHVVTLYRFHISSLAIRWKCRRSQRNIIGFTQSRSSTQQVSFPLFTFLRKEVKVSGVALRTIITFDVSRSLWSSMYYYGVRMMLKCTVPLLLFSLPTCCFRKHRKSFVCREYMGLSRQPHEAYKKYVSILKIHTQCQLTLHKMFIVQWTN